uniref:Uncharacterized protein n=1 Tax=Anopheles melas TaxID=34690 RepID=A0A182U177_9DIPT
MYVRLVIAVEDDSIHCSEFMCAFSILPICTSGSFGSVYLFASFRCSITSFRSSYICFSCESSVSAIEYVWPRSRSIWPMRDSSCSSGTMHSSSSVCCAVMNSSSCSIAFCSAFTFMTASLRATIFSPFASSMLSQAFTCVAWLVNSFSCSSSSSVHLLMNSSSWKNLSCWLAATAADWVVCVLVVRLAARPTLVPAVDAAVLVVVAAGVVVAVPDAPSDSVFCSAGLDRPNPPNDRGAGAAAAVAVVVAGAARAAPSGLMPVVVPAVASEGVAAVPAAVPPSGAPKESVPKPPAAGAVDVVAPAGFRDRVGAAAPVPPVEPKVGVEPKENPPVGAVLVAAAPRENPPVVAVVVVGVPNEKFIVVMRVSLRNEVNNRLNLTRPTETRNTRAINGKRQTTGVVEQLVEQFAGFQTAR